MYPDPPLEVVPEVKLKWPLTPETPESLVLRCTLPDDLSIPCPADRLI